MLAFVQGVIGEPVYLAGNSLGGFVGTNLAANHPRWVLGLALLNATPFWAFRKAVPGRPLPPSETEPSRDEGISGQDSDVASAEIAWKTPAVNGNSGPNLMGEAVEMDGFDSPERRGLVGVGWDTAGSCAIFPVRGVVFRSNEGSKDRSEHAESGLQQPGFVLSYMHTCICCCFLEGTVYIHGVDSVCFCSVHFHRWKNCGVPSCALRFVLHFFLPVSILTNHLGHIAVGDAVVFLSYGRPTTPVTRLYLENNEALRPVRSVRQHRPAVK